MGELSDMVIDGVLCELCGVYIGDSVGYPRKCVNCAGTRKKRRKKKRPGKEAKDGK